MAASSPPKDRSRIVSVNVSLPKAVAWQGRTIRTGIFKEPVSGRVRATRHGLAGDGQADQRVHGGRTKAVYAYPSEHYAYWRRELRDQDLPWGMFGENLTTEGLLETEVRVGDRFRVGTAILEVTQPRRPCVKLGIRFGREDIIPRFRQARRSGFYLAVVEEGELGAGDTIERFGPGRDTPTIDEIVRLSEESEEPQ